MKKLTNEIIDKRLKEQDRNIVRVGDYVNAHQKMEWKCVKCENQWLSTWNNISSGKGCPVCNLRLLTNEKVDMKLKENKRTLVRIGNVKNAKIKTEWKCLVCDYEWEARVGQVVYNNTDCPFCARQVDLTNENVDQRLVDESLSIERLDDIFNVKDRVRWKCLECDYIWSTTPNLILNKKTKCPRCSNREPWTNERLDMWLSVNNKQIKRVGNVKRTSDYIKFGCLKCSNVWDTKLKDMVNYKTGCPLCSRSKKYSEAAVDWLECVASKNNIKIQHIRNGKEYKLPGTRYRVDGYCEETNTLYEFYGDRFHGNPKMFVSSDKCHPFDKKITAGELYKETTRREKVIQDKGYNLITIWESEWQTS